MSPVFMIGTQRSGSNLLRLMLNQLDEIASPHPPHILERVYPLLDSYGDLNNDKQFKLLVDDVCRLVELNPVEWAGVKLDRKDIAKRCKENSLVAVYGAVYDVFAENKGAKSWCCKSLANINYIEQLEGYFNKPKYIYLYRDGRDVALSFQKAVVGEKHIYNIAKEWADTQDMAIRLRNNIKSNRLISISYEELTANTEATAKKLCKFLGVKYAAKMHEFHETDEAKKAAKSSTLWGNVTKPVMNNNSKKYRKEMSEQELKIFESVAGHVLDELGYERDLIKKGMEMKFSEVELQHFFNENKRLKAISLENTDKEDLERRNRQNSILKEIRSRTVAA
ncbi:MAG: sulfotransferase [Gammaproteobacteria bacterium]|nr:sulfotransferase [Gammaproteobacteria bacterium]